MNETVDRTESVFAGAVALENPAERVAYLDQACAADPALRARVNALLRAHERAGHLLDRPVAPELLTVDHVPAAEQPGTVLAGRYKLLEGIGEGGMGAVWVAEQIEPVRRKVAIKLIKPGMDSRSVLARFEAERQALALMDHPNIARVLDGGMTEAGRPFFVMDYVRGVPITRYCDEVRLSVPERLELFVQVCQAVQHAHQKGIIHRDLKPSNILVAPYDGRPVPKVIDFGLAKAIHQPLTEHTLHTGHETVLGTPLYMSPEQAQLNNLDVDTRTDIYALGVLLYELLTGTTPVERKRFKEAAWEEMRRIIREEEPPRPSARLSSTDTLPSLAACRQSEPARLTKLVRGELDWIVMKALDKERNRRYETANGFALDLQRFLAGEPVMAAPPSARYRLRKLAGKHRAALTIAAVMALLLVTGVAVSAWQAVRATAAETVALHERDEKEQARQDAVTDRDRAERAEKLAKARLEEVIKEKARADEESKIVVAVNKFLGRLLRLADARTQIEDGFVPQPSLTLKEVLDRASKEIDAGFKGQPQLEAALRTEIGHSYLGVGRPELGATHLEQAWSLGEKHLGVDHPLTLEAFNGLCVAYTLNRSEKAIPLLEQCVAHARATLGPDHRNTLTAMSNLAQAYYLDRKDKKALDQFEQLLPKCTDKLGPNDMLTLICSMKAAMLYLKAGQNEKAVRLLEQTLERCKASLKPDHEVTLKAMCDLAGAYATTDRIDKALPLQEEALAKEQAVLGADHPDTLTSMNDLALMYKQAKQLGQARSMLEQVLERRKSERELGNLADVYMELGNTAKAASLAEQGLARTTEERGPNHPDTIRWLGRLARMYWQMRKLDRSVPLYEEQLKRSLQVHGADHLDTISARANVGINYRDAGRQADGLRYLENSIADLRKVADPPPTDLIWIPRALFDTYEQTGQLAKAAALLEETLPQTEKRRGPDHPYTLSNFAKLGHLYWQMRRWDRSVPIYEELLKRSARVLGPDNEETVFARANLGVNYCDAGRMDEGIRQLEGAWAVLTKHPDPLPTGLAWIPVNLVTNYERAGQLTKAEPLYRYFVEKTRREHGADDLRTSSQLILLGMNLLAQKKYVDAQPVLRETLTIRRKKQPDDWTTFNTESYLGAALLGQKKYTEAEPLLRDGYQGMKQRQEKIPAVRKLRLREALELLVQLYETTGNKDETAKWRKELEAKTARAK
jgi:serine/threonine protein kinase